MMNCEFVKYFLFSIIFVCLHSHADGCSEVAKKNFLLSQNKNYSVEIKNLCDAYEFEINLVNLSTSINLGKFISPYSQTMYVQNISSNEKGSYLLTVDVAEPEPKGSYYFMVFNSDGVVHLSGYSDSLVYIEDIDSDGVEELVIGSNIDNIDPLELLVDYVPYPLVFDWGKSGKLELQPSTSYKSFYEKYLESLATYTRVIESKKNK
jgi:hypothetical protein